MTSQGLSIYTGEYGVAWRAGGHKARWTTFPPTSSHVYTVAAGRVWGRRRYLRAALFWSDSSDPWRGRRTPLPHLATPQFALVALNRGLNGLLYTSSVWSYLVSRWALAEHNGPRAPTLDDSNVHVEHHLLRRCIFKSHIIVVVLDGAVALVKTFPNRWIGK